MQRTAWRAYLLAGLASIVAYELAPVGVWRDSIYQLVGLSSAVAVLVGVRLHRPARPGSWVLMATGLFLWSVGDALISWDSTVLGNDRFPTPGDPFYLAGYPVVAAGLYLLIRGRWVGRDVAGLLDSAIVTAALGVLSWVLLAKPTIMTYQESFLAAAVAVAYPIGDIILVAMVIRLITTPGGRTASLRMLLGAIVVLVAVDTAATALDLLVVGSTHAIDFVWLASYVIWGAAALHPSMHELSQPTSSPPADFSRARLAALVAAVLVAPATLAVQQVAGDALDVWAVVVGSVVMFLLTVARMSVAIDQMTAANRDRAKAQEALAHQAAHDSLTGLPNRAQALELVEAALARAARRNEKIGVLYVDLDGFKNVNDTFGHSAGDELLRVVARRMVGSVRAGDVVARLGGDEFVVLLEPLGSEAAATAVANRLISVVSQPVEVAGGEARVGASIGVAYSRPGVTDPESFLDDADLAAYRAKRSGRGRAQVFDVWLRHELSERRNLETDLAAAIEADQLVLYYQPIVHVPTGEIEGYEALVRWIRADSGVVPAAEFIPAAEQSDLICELDSWAFGRATRQLAEWNERRGAADLQMAVNMSARHLGRPRIVDDVRGALEAAAIEPGQLVLEITETSLMDDPLALDHLRRLRALGVSISLDDFGTGYSSIARLERLPVDVVKVDRRFLDPTTKSGAPLLRLIVQTAHALDLAVVAEGVEEESQLAMLRAVQCESAQGYLLGRPVDSSEIDPTRTTVLPTLSRT